MTCRCGKHHVCATHLTLTSYARIPWWRRLLRRLWPVIPGLLILAVAVVAVWDACRGLTNR